MEIKLKVEIDLSENTTAVLRSLLTGVVSTALQQPARIAETPTPDPVVVNGGDTETGAPTTGTGRGRKKKPEEVAATTPAPTSNGKGNVDDLTGASSKKDISKEDLIAATQNAVFRSADNRDKIRGYLDEANVEKVTELPVNQWSVFLQFAEEL
jgi:hypothetical protein